MQISIIGIALMMAFRCVLLLAQTKGKGKEIAVAMPSYGAILFALKLKSDNNSRYFTSRGQNSAPPTKDELEVAKHQGARVTQVAAALKAAR